MALSIGELVGYVGLDTSEAEGAASKLTGFLDGVGGGWGKMLGAAGLAAGGLFGASLTGAIDLQAGNAKVAAALDLTTEQADRAGKVAGQVYADGWGDSSEEVQSALESVMSSIKGMRDASESELQAATTKALTFSSVMGVDVSRAAQVAGNMIHNGLAKNATEAFDLLTAASSKVPAELREDVLDATDEYGQFFTQLGIKGPEAMQMLADGAAKGMYGIDKAGDAVKEFTIRSTDMSTTSKQAYRTIGLNAKQMADDILAGGDRARSATDKVVKGLLGIEDPSKRANAAIKLFGTPLEDLSTKDIPVFLKSLQSGGDQLDGFKGATERAGKTVSDTAANHLQVFGRQVKMWFIDTLGNSVLPVVTKFTGVLADDLGPALSMIGGVLSATTGFLQAHQTTALALVGVIAALTAVTLAHSAAMAVSAAGGLAQWLMQTKLISAATKVWTAVQWAMNAALAANPITLVVIAIAALVAAIVIAWNKSDAFRAAVIAVWDAIKAAVSAVIGWFASAVPGAWEAVKSATTTAWNAIKSATSATWNAIKQAVSAVWDAIKAVVTTVGGAIKQAVSAVWNAIKQTTSTVLDAVKSVVSNAWNAIRDVTATVWGAIKGVIGPILGAIKALVSGDTSAAKAALSDAWHAAQNITQNVWNGIKSAIGNAIDAALDKVRGIQGAVTGAMSGAGSWLIDAGRRIIQGLIDGITGMLGSLRDKLSEVTHLIPDWKGPMEVDAKLLSPNGQAIMQSLVDGFDRGVPLVRRALSGLTGALPGMVGAPKLAAPTPAGGGIDYDRLADAVAARNDNTDVVEAMAGVKRAIAGLPRDYRIGERKGVSR